MTTDTRNGLRFGIVAGCSMAVTLAVIVAMMIAVLGDQQTETLRRIETSNTHIAGAFICGFGAPVVQEEQPDGTIVSTRPEPFLNAICLIPQGFDPIDSDGDGVITTEGEG